MTAKWWTLVGACFGLFLLMLDSTVVSLALPRIRGDVGASAEQLQWMMNSYLLTIAVLVVTAGRLGDIFGRRRIFLLGMLGFGIGSVVSGDGGRSRRADPRADPAGRRRGAGADALAGPGLQRLPRSGGAEGARDLGGESPPRRWRSGRWSAASWSNSTGG